MKNTKRIFGFIAIVAVIGIGMAGCGPADPEPELLGTLKITWDGDFDLNHIPLGTKLAVVFTPAEGFPEEGTVEDLKIKYEWIEYVSGDTVATAREYTPTEPVILYVIASADGYYSKRSENTVTVLPAPKGIVGKWFNEGIMDSIYTFKRDGTFEQTAEVGGSTLTVTGTYLIEDENFTIFSDSTQDYTLVDDDNLTIGTTDYERIGTGTGLVGKWFYEPYTNSPYGYEFKADGTYELGYFDNDEIGTASSYNFGKYTYTGSAITISQAAAYTFIISDDGDTITLTSIRFGSESVLTRVAE